MYNILRYLNTFVYLKIEKLNVFHRSSGSPENHQKSEKLYLNILTTA